MLRFRRRGRRSDRDHGHVGSMTSNKQEEKTMLKHYLKLLVAAATFLIAATASAQEPLKIGMVLEMSGGFADFGMQMMNGARAYMKVHGDTVAGRKVELIVRDTTGVPDVAKRVAQE